MMFLVVLLAAAALGQEGGRLQFIKDGGATTPYDDSEDGYGGLLGIGINPLEANMAEYYTVSSASSNPRYYKGAFKFEDGMVAIPTEVGSIPLIDGEQSVQPSGAHFCGKYLYVAAQDGVRRFDPSQAEAGVDGRYVLPEEFAGALGGVTLSEEDKSNKYVYAISEQVAAGAQAAAIFEWRGNDASAAGAQAVRQFRLPLSAGERVMDMAWVMGRRFAYLVAEGGEEDFRPSALRLYTCQIPAPASSDFGKISQLDEAQMLGRQLVAEFSVNAAKQLEVQSAGQSSAVAFNPPLDSIPAFHGIVFGRDEVPDSQGGRPVFCISDNGFQQGMPTRYFSAIYYPPSPANVM